MPKPRASLGRGVAALVAGAAPPMGQPDTSWRTLRAEVLAAARYVVIAYEEGDGQLTGSLLRRLDTLAEMVRAFDAAPPE